jgi:lysophospholipase L1-like esterase
MAEILQARVEQKVDTEANWLANPLPLLPGEQAFVLSPDGITPMNFKIGVDGIKTFSELPYWIDYASNVVIASTAPGGTLPSPADAGKIMIVGGGTYHQPTGGGTIVCPDSSFNVLFWDGAAWSLSFSVVITLDPALYYTKSETDDKLNTLSGAHTAFTRAPNLALGSFTGTQLAGNAINYYNNWAKTGIRVVNKITINSTVAGSVVVVKFSSTNTTTDIITLTTTVGVVDYTLANISLANNENLGIRKISGSIPYTSTGGIGMYASDTGSIIANYELAYTISGYIDNSAAFDTLVTLTGKVATNTTNIGANTSAITSNTISIATNTSDIKTITGVNPSFSFAPNNAYSLISSFVITAGTDYYNIYDSTAIKLVNKVTIKALTAGSVVVTKFSASNVVTDIQTVTTTVGVIDYTITDTTLQVGEHLGIRVLSGTVPYIKTAGVGIFTGSAPIPLWEIGYSISGYYPTGGSFDSLVKLTSEVNSLLAIPADKVELFGDDFSTLKSDWQATGWSYATGTFTSSATGMNNRLNLNRPYHADKRNGRFIVKLSSDSDLRIHCKYGGAGNVGEGATLIGINAVTNKLTIYAANSAVAGTEPYSTTGVQETVSLVQTSVIIDSTHDYLVEVIKDDLVTSVNLVDTITGTIYNVSYTGWSCGRQNENYGFYVYSGGPCIVKKVSVICLNKPRTVVVGDSITEGVYVVINRLLRWADVYRSKAFGQTIISARGGDTIDGVISMFASEYSIYKPSNMILMIGANGGLTTAKVQQVVDLCATNNIKLYWNKCTCDQAGDLHIALNATLAPFNFRGCKFDMATALQNFPTVDGLHPSPRYNPALYGDSGLHPNDAGQVEMVKRFILDIPELIKTYS